MPPVMGAAAFGHGGIPRRGLPDGRGNSAGPGDPVLCCLFFAAVHFEAKRKGIGSVPKEDKFR